ncbi:hypothetical protein SISNIDRAFT_13611 [Sistotremastrum niveocremeum HHB9708]|uniref:Uncharacterized protein n=1 Tax=Sistotremastrum niveocremeum HHB9708 TaxID=1314777 RepID=A0A165AKD4_9AGAM|nr:hypothetical protein SISNIDRAFT_13611 [Sistotremastrum niveocremeum HHB9708]
MQNRTRIHWRILRQVRTIGIQRMPMWTPSSDTSTYPPGLSTTRRTPKNPHRLRSGNIDNTTTKRRERNGSPRRVHSTHRSLHKNGRARGAHPRQFIIHYSTTKSHTTPQSPFPKPTQKHYLPIPQFTDTFKLELYNPRLHSQDRSNDRAPAT